ncbi:MAG: hypothetical protein ACK5C4_01485, partial [Pseudanabaena sp.]
GVHGRNPFLPATITLKKNRFLQPPRWGGLQKTDLGVSSAFIPVTPKYKNCCVTGMKIVKHSLMHD